MNLNPPSSNYLNNFAFQKHRNRNLPSTHQKMHNQPQLPKKTKSNIVQKQQKQQPLPQQPQTSRSILAQFQLKQKLNKSHFFYTRQGYLFGLKKRDGNIEKRAAIVFPDGTIANCYVLRGKLNGWTVLCKRNSFYNIFQYKNSRLEGNQFIYDIKCGLMLRSNYLNGRLKSIYKCSAQNQTKFQKFVNNKAIYNILKQTLNCQFFKSNFPCVQSSMGNFYGKKVAEIPHGVGIVITPQQLFYGQFDRGLLNGIGTMSFQGGNYYIGQLHSGLTKGIGQYSTNGKLVYKYNEEQINQEIFHEYFQVVGWQENEEIRKVFAPIVSFYLKLRKIQIQRISEPENKDVSIIDVQFVAEEEEQGQGTDRKDSSSSPQTERLQIITTAPINKRQTIVPRIQEKQDLKESKNEKNLDLVIQENPLIEVKMEEQESKAQNQKKNVGKMVKKDKKKQKATQKEKEKNKILNDSEWQEIIEQLEGQESVGREDGFLQPNKQSLKEGDSGEISSKSNPLNSNQKRIDLVKIREQDKKGQVTEKQQNNLNKFIRKPTKKP